MAKDDSLPKGWDRLAASSLHRGEMVGAQPRRHASHSHCALRNWGRAAALPAVLLVAGCGASDQPVEDTSSNLHAVISIERSRELSFRAEDIQEVSEAAEEVPAAEAIADEPVLSEEPTGTALAQFLLLPSDLDPHRTLDWAGLKSSLPQPSGCFRSSPANWDEPEHKPSWNGADEDAASRSDSLELLAAGKVRVVAGDRTTDLVLNLYPPSGSASGVLYSSRDRSAAPLPPDTFYEIDVTGSEQVPAMTVTSLAPAELHALKLQGQPVDLLAEVSLGHPMEWTWDQGEEGDRIYVHLAQVSGPADSELDSPEDRAQDGTPRDRQAQVICAFEDQDGRGLIPDNVLAELASSSLVRVAVHRVREVQGAEELAKGPRELGRNDDRSTLLETTMRFDFEFATTLRVQ